MTKMNVPALKKLKELLKTDAKKPKGVTFNMSVWGELQEVPTDIQDKYYNDAVPPTTAKKLVKLNCNTQVCALGLAAISGKFKGLTYELDGSGIIRITDGKHNADPLSIGCKVFGLTPLQFHYLFMPDYYELNEGAKAELQVMERIDLLIAYKDVPSQALVTYSV